MTGQLYSASFADTTPADLFATVRRLGATLVDVRLKATSRFWAWQQINLGRALGHQYTWCAALGEAGRQGAAFHLRDEAAGLALVRAALARGPVVLICACPEVSDCHRRYIAERLEALHEISCIHLPPGLCTLDQPRLF